MIVLDECSETLYNLNRWDGIRVNGQFNPNGQTWWIELFRVVDGKKNGDGEQVEVTKTICFAKSETGACEHLDKIKAALARSGAGIVSVITDET